MPGSATTASLVTESVIGKSAGHIDQLIIVKQLLINRLVAWQSIDTTAGHSLIFVGLLIANPLTLSAIPLIANTLIF